MRLYFRYVTILFRSQMQYRASFWLMTTGQFLVPFTLFAGMYLLFARFGQIRGWTFYEAALVFAVIGLASAISECFARGFDSFSVLVAGGDFDRLLVRPRATVLQVLGSNFEFTRFGRLAQNLTVLVWTLSRLPIDWNAGRIVTLAFMIGGGTFIFTGIYMLAATLSFWTIQGLEVANIFTDGGREMAQYPLNIYQRWVTIFFTFVIPFGCVNYLPLLYLLGRVHDHPLLYMLLPLAGALFLLPCLLVWRFGVRHYCSTGS
ncbi:ABC transporter permease [Paenibacillus humicola]|uniref:ABC transporter permease n=1 Tax=Paenibacillus humicola TaxID=3110540 RepID=UPI00237C3BC4|nr:ABC-2 family transporter protein [Paenibacillus humicola]